MWFGIDRLGLVLFDATVATAVFLSLIVLAVSLCRQPTGRLLIARVALFACLATIPLAVIAPLPRFDFMRALAMRDLLPAPLFVRHEHTGRWRSRGYASEWAPLDLSVLSRQGAKLAPWTPRGLVLFDLAGITVGCAWMLLGFGGVHWLIRSGRQPSLATRNLFERLLGGSLAHHRKPNLLVSARVQHPVVVGLLRPTILIPPELEDEDGDPERLRLSLLHEIAHVERSDHRHGMVASLAQAVWFFLPHVWWLRSRVLIDQEFLADRMAARRYGTSSGYAASLLTFAQTSSRSTAESQAGGPTLGVSGSGKTKVPSPLFQRVLMLLHCPFPVETQLCGAGFWVLRAAVIAFSVLSACILFRWPSAEAFDQTAGSALQQPHTFCVTDFVAEPLIFTPGSRALPYVLPVALPSHFELSVEVRCNVADLSRVRIAGCALAPLELPSETGVERPLTGISEAESWHHVRILRTGNELALWVDGRPTPVVSSPEPMTEWLTIEPGPNRVAQFRNLVLTW
jgi:hypothetical protein